MSLAGLLIAFVAFQTPGDAAPPQAELVWLQATSTSACQEEALRQAVAVRLGYDPFVPSHSTKVLVEVTGHSPLTARVRLARQGKAMAERVLSGPADCRQLIDALALALAVAVDPLVLTRAAPAPLAPPPMPQAEPPPKPAAPGPPPPVPVVAAPVTPPPKPIETHLSFAALGAIDWGQHPGGFWGARLGGKFRLAFVSLGLAGWSTFPSQVQLPDGGSVSGLSVGGIFDVCFHAWWLAGCVAAKGGALRYQGFDLVDARQGWAPTVHAGPRLLLELPGTSAVAAHIGGELWFSILRTHMLVSGTAEWQQPLVAGSVVLGIAFRAW